MIKVASYSKTGNKKNLVNLDAKIFGLEINHSLLNQAYQRYLANLRNAHAKTKTRKEVSGGGKKPWRQKGTGRARAGSIRSPLWRGGGVTFGPTGRQNFAQKMPKKMRLRALAQALSAKASKLKLIEAVKINAFSTQRAVNLLAKIGAEGKTLIVVEKLDLKTEKSFANLPDVELIHYGELNVFNLLNADTVVIELPALSKITALLEVKK